jgi:RNA recognition motif-containing protein
MTPTKKLFVSGIAYRTQAGSQLGDAELNAFFAAAGTVTSAKIITDRDTGLSRGFGFVEMATVEEAQKAIDMFNGQEMEGRAITVRFSEERPAGERRSFGNGGGRRVNYTDRNGGSDRGGFGGGSRRRDF